MGRDEIATLRLRWEHCLFSRDGFRSVAEDADDLFAHRDRRVNFVEPPEAVARAALRVSLGLEARHTSQRLVASGDTVTIAVELIERLALRVERLREE